MREEGTGKENTAGVKIGWHFAECISMDGEERNHVRKSTYESIGAGGENSGKEELLGPHSVGSGIREKEGGGISL
eukprot:2734024-Rhodomonas_salina.2